jgi:hypothetical protein
MEAIRTAYLTKQGKENTWNNIEMGKRKSLFRNWTRYFRFTVVSDDELSWIRVF